MFSGDKGMVILYKENNLKDFKFYFLCATQNNLHHFEVGIKYIYSLRRR